MTRPTPTEILADAIATGDAARTAAEIDRLIQWRILRATGKSAPEPVQQTSRTTQTYR